MGAGASKDFGLPLGIELAASIRGSLHAELTMPAGQARPLIDTALLSGASGDYGEAARDLCGGLISARSIDRLLDSRKDRPLVVSLGKLGVVSAIAQREAASYIGQAVDSRDWPMVHTAMVQSNESWLARLFSLLQEGVPPSKASSIFASFGFVTFNYDRSIQRYLHLAFQQVMTKSFKEAAELVDAIPIIHVYGSLGSLPSPQVQGVPFGPSGEYLQQSAASIRTFTEGAADGTMGHARSLIQTADLIVFLGFAFDPLNVDVLFERALHDEQSVIGTRLGLADSDAIRATNKIGKHLHTFTHQLRCNELILDERFKTALFN